MLRGKNYVARRNFTLYENSLGLMYWLKLSNCLNVTMLLLTSTSAKSKMDPILVLEVNTNWFKITTRAESKMDSQLVVVLTQT